MLMTALGIDDVPSIAPSNTSTVAPDLSRAVITPASADALPFVLSKYGRGFQATIGGRTEDFLHDFGFIQAAILRRSKVLTAMDGDRIAGFIVYENETLHWIYVRGASENSPEYRRQGIAIALIQAAGLKPDCTVSAWTRDLNRLLPAATHRPFWLTKDFK